MPVVTERTSFEGLGPILETPKWPNVQYFSQAGTDWLFGSIHLYSDPYPNRYKWLLSRFAASHPFLKFNF
jgi:hypothetical protein